MELMEGAELSGTLRETLEAARALEREVHIPAELGDVLADAVCEGRRRARWASAARFAKRTAGMAAGLLICFTALVNLFPAFAAAAYDIPVLGSLCRICTFQEYRIQDEVEYIHVKIPAIEDTGKSDLEKQVNQEIRTIVYRAVEDSKAFAREDYEAFVATGGDPGEFMPIEATIDYEVHCITPALASFSLTRTESKYSFRYERYFYNIDMETGRVFTLRDYLGSDFARIVADSVEETIAGWDEEEKFYLWPDVDYADVVTEQTDFYINGRGQLVVVFPKYEVAAGAAGAMEFVIQMPPAA